MANLELPPLKEYVGLEKLLTEEFRMTVPDGIFSVLLADTNAPEYPTATSVTEKVEFLCFVTPFESVAITDNVKELVVS